MLRDLQKRACHIPSGHLPSELEKVDPSLVNTCMQVVTGRWLRGSSREDVPICLSEGPSFWFISCKRFTRYMPNKLPNVKLPVGNWQSILLGQRGKERRAWAGKGLQFGEWGRVMWGRAENQCVGEAQVLELSWKAPECRNSHTTFIMLPCLHIT